MTKTGRMGASIAILIMWCSSYCPIVSGKMLAKTFEIKVAVLGNVSAGKSTVLNTLFRAKVSEVTMKRPTVGSNFFRIHTKEVVKSYPKQVSLTDTSTDGSSSQETASFKSDWLLA